MTKPALNTNIAACNGCQKNINLPTVKLAIAHVVMQDGENLTLQYFKCPHCGMAYKVALYSPKVRLLQKALREAEVEYQLALQRKARTSVINRCSDTYRKAKNIYTSAFDDLNEKYAGQTYQQIDTELDFYVPGHNPDNKEA